MIRKAYNPREERKTARQDIKAKAAAFALAVQNAADNGQLTDSEREFAKRTAGNAWKIADWPSE